MTKVSLPIRKTTSTSSLVTRIRAIVQNMPEVLSNATGTTVASWMTRTMKRRTMTNSRMRKRSTTGKPMICSMTMRITWLTMAGIRKMKKRTRKILKMIMLRTKMKKLNLRHWKTASFSNLPSTIMVQTTRRRKIRSYTKSKLFQCEVVLACWVVLIKTAQVITCKN